VVGVEHEMIDPAFAERAYRSQLAPWLISLESSHFASFGAHLRIRGVLCLPGGPDGAVFGNVSHLGLRRC
jgi:hypothetical protein